MEFKPNEYKTVEPKKLSEKDKVFIIAFVLMMIVVVVMLLHNDKFKVQEVADADNDFRVPESDIQTELGFVVKKISEDRKYEDFCSKTYHLQLAFALNEQGCCFMGLKKTRDLYIAGFNSEALVEYANVAHTVLNTKIQAKKKFFKAIEIAFNKGLIDQSQRGFLHQLRMLRNKKVHTPGLNLDKEITDLYLNTNLNSIDQLFLC